MGAVSGAVGSLLIATLAIDAHQPLSTAGTVRLRPTQAIGHRLLAESVTRSPTVRRLVEELAASDVIIYLDVRADMSPHIVGSLRFLAPTVSDRYLRITLNRQHDWPTLIAFLGHELQHANEIAGARDVRSAEDLRAFYQRVGIRVGRNAYDSREAQATGHVVRAELRGESSPVLNEQQSTDRILSGSGSIQAATP
jgi:hypothetical protein